MSDNWLIIIPVSPEFVPARHAIEQAATLYRAILPNADEIEINQWEHPQYIDCGSNLSRILCPHSGREIDMDLWANAMDAAYKSQFRDLRFRSPHSEIPTTLADLHYDWPIGFARFSLEARNPNVSELSEEQLQQIRKHLECDVRVIWRHI